MARILLVSTNTTTEPYPVYPLGMGVVAAALMRAGHKVSQFDYLAAGQTMDALDAVLREFKPDMTGISLRNIDNVDSLSSDKNWYLAHVRDITRFLGEQGQTVVVGGPGFSLMPEPVLEYLGADCGVVGEGEKKMVRLADMLANGETLPRLMRPETGLDAPDMLSPAWDENILAYYLKQSGIANIQTKRGCDNRCVYCSYPAIEGGNVRPRDPLAVVEEMKELRDAFGVDFVFFTDSVFNDAGGLYLEVAEALAREDLGMNWSAFFQPTRIDTRTLRLLKRSGLASMEVGTDASTNETLRAMNKPFTFEDVRAFNETCVNERIPCAHFVIFGGPGETMKTIERGIDNLNSLDSCVVFPFSGIRLHKGTPLYARAIHEKVVPTNADLLMPHYYFSPMVDAAAMNLLLGQGFSGRRDRIFPPSDGQDRMNVLRRFGYRGLLWDTLISFPETVAHGKDKEARP